ncbi:MAG: FAD binding domain-containing protein [Acidimicrobiia bacterium]
MQPSAFDYHRPSTVEEAIGLLSSIEGARALAGGHSLLPAMKLRLSTPTALVDIGRIPGLSGIQSDGDHLTIGALTTHAEVERSELVKGDCPILAEAAATIGDHQVRNLGTIGGSLAHADPAADYPTVVTALGATITATGSGGQREIAASDFFQGLFATALEDGELITSVQVPKLGVGTGGAYVKHRHPASSYAVVGVAALVALADGTCSEVRVSIGGVTANPVSISGATKALGGKEPTDDAIAAAAGTVADAISDPIGDLYASGEFRVHLAEVLTKRALSAAVDRAG